jgi:hypothetical protein
MQIYHTGSAAVATAHGVLEPCRVAPVRKAMSAFQRELEEERTCDK